MTAVLPSATVTRLEKVAVDNGFDLELPREGVWLAAASTQARLRIWLTRLSEAQFFAAFSDAAVAAALDVPAPPVSITAPAARWPSGP